LVVSGGPVRPNGSTGYGERACSNGSLGEVRGVGVMPRLTQLLRS
jgi:2,3-bisphosphoglycerate-independent phosphoglycerate mutase